MSVSMCVGRVSLSEERPRLFVTVDSVAFYLRCRLPLRYPLSGYVIKISHNTGKVLFADCLIWNVTLS